MSLITPFPEAESPALDRFALDDRDGIAALLGQLSQRGSLVTLYFDDASGFTVGNVLAVDAEGDAFVLDCAGDGDVQRAIAEVIAILLAERLKRARSEAGIAVAGTAQPGHDRQRAAADPVFLPADRGPGCWCAARRPVRVCRRVPAAPVPALWATTC